MSQFASIKEFNTYLSNDLKNLNLNDYFRLIHAQFYNKIDISFMDYFLELCEHENEFVVEHQKLKEYGVLTNIETSKDIKKSLDRLFIIENEDYQLGQVSQPVKQGGFSIRKEYKLTPFAFKLCLIRSKNSKEYAKYYLLLEQVFKNYQEYQIMYQKVLLSGKDTRIDNLLQETKKQSAQINELLGYAKKTVSHNEKLKETVDNMNDEIKDMNDEIKDMNDEIKNLNETVEDLNETVEDLNENIEDINETVDEIKQSFKDTADRSVPSPKNEIERHEFILLQSKENNNKFTFLRGIKELNENKINRKYSNYNIIKREFNANPVALFRQFKETMRERFEVEKNKIKNSKMKNKVELKRKAQKVKISNIRLELLNDYSLTELLDDLTNVCNDKFKDYNLYENTP